MKQHSTDPALSEYSQAATIITYAHYHQQRRDDLMKAARTLKHQVKPNRGSYMAMQDCVRRARLHNQLARLQEATEEATQ